MNRVFLFLLLTFTACQSGNKKSVQQAVISDTIDAFHIITGDTVHVDLAMSDILWKGTKMRGAGKHEGIIQLQNGYLLTQNGHLTGGRFTVDMTTIQVTDIPKHEPVPRKRLNDHLKSSVFFAVDKYPTSHFAIIK